MAAVYTAYLLCTDLLFVLWCLCGVGLEYQPLNQLLRLAWLIVSHTAINHRLTFLSLVYPPDTRLANGL